MSGRAIGVVLALALACAWTGRAGADVTGRVTFLDLVGQGGTLVYFTLADPACAAATGTFNISKDDPDGEFAVHALLAARLGGREVKLSGAVCPSIATTVSALNVRLIESSPAAGPPYRAAGAGLSGTVTNIKVWAGYVYFRISACSGGAPYFKFSSARLRNGLAFLLAALSSKRHVEVYTSAQGTGICPTVADLDIGVIGGLRLL